jgi:predicted RecA/RadA family phage recombinase
LYEEGENIVRLILSAIALMFAVSEAQAQRIDSVEIVAAGIYKLGKVNAVTDKSISTGQHLEANATLIKKTTVIPAKKDTVIGVTVVIRGKPRDKVVPVRVVWHYPEPGLRNPDTGVAKLMDDYVAQKSLGRETEFYWDLADDWVLVTGVWIVELYDNDRLLAKQSFTLTKQ